MASEMGFKSSVNVKAAGGDPKKVAVNLPHDGDKALFSFTVGEARSLGTKREDTREPGKFIQGLTGYFEVVDPETGAAVASKNLYAPEAIHDMIVAALKGDEENGVRPALVVRVAYESYVVKGGTAGFTWLHEVKTTGEHADPLADLRKLVGKRPEVQQIEGPETEGKRGKKHAA
jgi:hypothetical protein